MVYILRLTVLLSSVALSCGFQASPVPNNRGRPLSAAAQPTTPNQIKLLRKESSKRRSRKQLPQVWLEDGSDERLKAIAQEFTSRTELVEVRGISKENIRHVFAESERLAMELGFVTEKTVDLVETKGHASTFYCPVEGDGSIVLRTSYKDGAWSKQPKAPRDHRGQIIK